MDTPRDEGETGTLKRRGSGVSINLQRAPSNRAQSRPNSMAMDSYGPPQQYGYNMMQPGFPILVNPPPIPTVKSPLF